MAPSLTTTPSTRSTGGRSGRLLVLSEQEVASRSGATSRVEGVGPAIPLRASLVVALRWIASFRVFVAAALELAAAVKWSGRRDLNSWQEPQIRHNAERV